MPGMRRATPLLAAMLLLAACQTTGTPAPSSQAQEQTPAWKRPCPEANAAEQALTKQRRPNIEAVASSGDAEAPYAQYRLGSFYYYGEYLEQDRIEGLRRWRLAAEGDEPAAQYALAKALVREGPRGTSSHGEALYWFQRAHLQASRDAGVGSDPSEDSSDWRLAKSAEAAFAHQAYLLGRDRRDGVGGPQDRVGAMMWFMIAANKGSHLAADALQEEPIGLSEMQVEAIKEEPIESALLDKGSNISTLHQDLEKAKHLAVLCEQSFYRHCG
jgi:TPR repeat protein